jgi:dipeptidyl aminopeptidase/acylaminoacyl peptidase
MKRGRAVRVALAALAVVLTGASDSREPPMRETLAAIDATLAREDAAVTNGDPETLWVDARHLLYRASADSLTFMLLDVGNGNARPITADTWLSPALAAAGISDKTKINGMSDDRGTLYLATVGAIYAVNLANHAVTPATARMAAAKAYSPRLISDQFPTTFGPLMEGVSPDGQQFIGRRDDNIVIRDAKSGTVRALTTDGAPRYSWLDTEESSEGLNAAWSPDGTRIAAVRLDSRSVHYEPLMRWLTRAPTVQEVAYPRAGDAMHKFDLAVVDVASGKRVMIDTGDTSDHYLNLIGWCADGRSLLYQVIDREHKRLQIVRADAASGSIHPILTETSDTYIDTPMTLSPVLVRPLESGGFVYLSERDGWRHLYRYDENGRLVRRLTTGGWPVEDIARIDDRWVYFTAARDKPYQAALYRVALKGGRIERLTPEGNARDIAFSPDGHSVVLTRSTPTMPPITEVRSNDGRLIAVLGHAKLVGTLPVLEPIATSANDPRFTVNGLILRPAGFDPTRRYPVVEIIYGGMQLDFLPRDAYPTGWWRHGYNALMGRLLSADGFVVIYMNAPGTPGRGRAFQDATYGRWPQGVIADHAKLIRDAAASRPWMDLTRVGVFGNSWGGYLAQRALIDAPDLYKAAVTMAPPSDFSDHPTYIEPFMGLPEHNVVGYAAGSNLTRLDRIEGSVLIMPEPLDVNAGFSPAMKFVDGMIAAGGDVELFTMPEVNHRVTCCGWPRERYAYAVATRYLHRKIGQLQR